MNKITKYLKPYKILDGRTSMYLKYKEWYPSINEEGLKILVEQYFTPIKHH